MREYNLEGRKMTDKTRTHEHLAHRLELPDSYGRNLDALWDALMAIRKTSVINFNNPDAAIENLGQYGELLLQTFKDAARANHKVVLELDED